MIEQRFARAGKSAGASAEDFNVEEAVLRLDDPAAVMSQWLQYESREYPQDYGVVFFKGWQSFTPEEKVEAVRDAKRVLDRSLKE
jgi:hypothetical protein